jgi:ubiquinone/menaquinone biosynthesis C-methylase UbiE
MAYIDFIPALHQSTKRDYMERVTMYDKAACAEKAKQWGYDYWDGDRKYGFGGYKYDGRWRPVAEEMARHYRLKAGDRILDVGCGKAFLLHELTQVRPGVEVAGVDISEYAIEHAKEEVKAFLRPGHARKLPYDDNSFDFVLSLNTLHNLEIYDLFSAIKEIERVGRRNKYIVVESYRNERERVNMLYWQLTCASFYRPEEWQWIFEQCGYSGDYGFIYFE